MTNSTAPAAEAHHNATWLLSLPTGECISCHGSGRIDVDLDDPGVTCHDCSGAGFVLDVVPSPEEYAALLGWDALRGLDVLDDANVVTVVRVYPTAGDVTVEIVDGNDDEIRDVEEYEVPLAWLRWTACSSVDARRIVTDAICDARYDARAAALLAEMGRRPHPDDEIDNPSPGAVYGRLLDMADRLRDEARA